MCSYYLWSISRPGKTGTPNFDLAQDEEAAVANSGDLTPVQLLHERVITKVFRNYQIPLEITDVIRAAMKSKLWRMGKLFSKLGGKNGQQQLLKWKEGKDSIWNFEVSEIEVNRQLCKRKHYVEDQLDEQRSKAP